MNKYILKQDAITAACKGFCHPGVRCPDEPCREQTKYLRELPSADVVQVVRCKDCKHSEHWYRDKARCFLWHEEGIDVFENGYCSYAERKE